MLLARFIAEDASASLTSDGKLNADCDGSEGLTAEDTTRILQYIAKLITKDEFEKNL